MPQPLRGHAQRNSAHLELAQGVLLSLVMNGTIEAQVRFLDGDADALVALELQLPENCRFIDSLVGKLVPFGIQILQLRVNRRSNRLRHRIRIALSNGESIRPPQRHAVQSALLELLDDTLSKMRESPSLS